MLSAQTGLIILGIVLVIVGGKKLPELGKGVGQAIANFKKGMSEPDAIDVTPKKDETAKPKEEDSSKKA